MVKHFVCSPLLIDEGIQHSNVVVVFDIGLCPHLETLDITIACTCDGRCARERGSPNSDFVQSGARTLSHATQRPIKFKTQEGRHEEVSGRGSHVVKVGGYVW
jgi:hypothetical protein